VAERGRQRKSAPETAHDRGPNQHGLTTRSDSGRRESRDPFAEFPNPEWYDDHLQWEEEVGDWIDEWEPVIREWREKAEKWDNRKSLLLYVCMGCGNWYLGGYSQDGYACRCGGTMEEIDTVRHRLEAVKKVEQKLRGYIESHRGECRLLLKLIDRELRAAVEGAAEEAEG